MALAFVNGAAEAAFTLLELGANPKAEDIVHILMISFSCLIFSNFNYFYLFCYFRMEIEYLI